MSIPVPLSLTRHAGKLVFVSGKLGADPRSGVIPEGDITGQTDLAMTNLEKDLSGLGLSLKNVVKTTVFLTEIRNFSAMNEVHRSRFPEPVPARSTIGVASLPDVDALVEIEFVAYAETAPTQ